MSSPDVVILNTCSVTAAADNEVRAAVRRFNKQHPSARIVVTGCYAQRAPEEAASLPGVSMVVGNSHKHELAPLLLDGPAPFHGEIHVSDIFEQTQVTAAPVEGPLGDRSRPNLKIQDGCNNRCSFCIIPFVRGRSRSATAEDVVRQVRQLSVHHAEVVLTGINLGRWGREAGTSMRLADLLRLLLSETDVQRVRLSSVEPMDWSDDLLQLVASEHRIAKHVHAPLQSGSDAVLRRMHRKYRPRHYVDRILKAHEWMPDAAFGADVMTGFPGETEAEFAETVDLIESLPFTYLHVFPYSERPGTPAAERANQVPGAVRKQRARRLIELGRRKSLAFRERMIGKRLSAAVLHDARFAITTNYLTVELDQSATSRTLIETVPRSLTAQGLSERVLLPVLESA